MERTNKSLSILTAGLVLFLASAAFVLSYDALHDMAKVNGVKPGLAWLWPLTLDAFMIAASLAVLRAGLNGEGTHYPWLLVGVFTVASIIFNVLHAPANLTARAIYGLPPFVVFLSFELLMSQASNGVKGVKLEAERQARIEKIRQGIIIPDDLEEFELYANVKKTSAAWPVLRKLVWERDSKHCVKCDANLNNNVYHCHHIRHEHRGGPGKPSNLITLCEHCHGMEHQDQKDETGTSYLELARETKAANKKAALAACLDYYRDNPDASLAEAGRAIGRSKTTVGTYLNELADAGAIERNGAGVQIIGGDR